ncbi:tRNA (adenosine(37)-N6)-dimethylallyltransferase MiaA [candidate division WWE3 bacterium]|uniref:tRNA dimethylallyltransferase n=1 Tax=candidate division WWE3 bacterium TaxID=2053526 RepID=A0A955EC78_UNCKA|nr:tRNA (adenosine(37)-N6)-dimethylallyltransferase MiaA [candidate division WWE3 bacterium]
MHNVFVVVGPTSSGKTSLALNLCKKYGGCILSADSRQVYKGLDIGTGKQPINSTYNIERFEDKWLVDGVVIWGYDIIGQEDDWTGDSYARFARSKILENLGTNIFLVGGTGFYIDLVTGKMQTSGIMPNSTLRKNLEATPLPKLLEQLSSLNPKALTNLDTNNPARIIRAIEIAKGQKINTTPLPDVSNINFVHVGLTADREFLYERADKWVDYIWENGLLDEVKNNLAYASFKPMQGLIYKTVIAYLNNELAQEAAIQRIKWDMHAYIRRQQTWFKKNTEIKWFNIYDSSLLADVESYLNLLQ